MNAKSSSKYREFILYTTVGVSATAINWITYSVLVAFVPMIIANAMSWAITVIYTFVTNKIYVFHSLSFERKIVCKELITFLASRGVTGVLEVVAQPQLYAMGMDQPLFGVEGLKAKITVCVILSIINYISTKLFVFRENDTKTMESI